MPRGVGGGWDNNGVRDGDGAGGAVKVTVGDANVGERGAVAVDGLSVAVAVEVRSGSGVKVGVNVGRRVLIAVSEGNVAGVA